jgi:hypothetical protein
MDKAREKFPLSAAADRITGDGPYALASRREAPRVALFDSVRRRERVWNDWDDTGCCESCTGKHRSFNLENGQ